LLVDIDLQFILCQTKQHCSSLNSEVSVGIDA